MRRLASKPSYGEGRRGSEPRSPETAKWTIWIVVGVLAALAAAGTVGTGLAQAQFSPSTTGGESGEGLEGADTQMPQASPGDSLADERRENGDLEEITAEDGDESTSSADAGEESTAAVPAAPSAASTPTGGAELFGGPAWMVGAMFALGLGALVIVYALRRSAASADPTRGGGEIFEKRGQRRGGRSERG